MNIKAQKIQLERTHRLQDTKNYPKFSPDEQKETIKEKLRAGEGWREKNQHMFNWSPRNTRELNHPRGSMVSRSQLIMLQN